MDLKELRNLANLTRKQVARKLNIDVSCVSHWELNDWAPPQKHWRKLAKMYNVTESEIKMLADEIREGNKVGA
nr:MAG TPA: Helix-turn-helix XRE-family like protein [Caudoviricetes sp.]